MTIRTACISFLLLVATMATLSAQVTVPGKSIVNKGGFAWKYVSSPQFDIYFYTPDDVMAVQVAKMAEESLHEIKETFDYQTKTDHRYNLYFYTNPFDLIQSNQYQEKKLKETGRTQLPSNSANVVFPSNTKELRGKVKAAITELIITEFYYGGSIQTSISNSVLLHTPSWYMEGLSLYVGEGWTYRDEQWMTGLGLVNLLDYAVEGDNEINRIVRKSVWYYIVQEYGEEKLAEIFYMTQLTRSVEGGILSVLGPSLKRLTDKWREFMRARISNNTENRVSHDEFARLIPIPSGTQMTGMALHPKGKTVAVAMLKGGKGRVELYDLSSRKFKNTGIHGGFPTDQLDGVLINSIMSWSKDGRFLLTTIFRDGNERLALYDTKSDKVTYHSFRPTLERVLAMDWASDNQQVVISGLKHGAIDLFLHKPGSNQFREFIEDAWDNLDPHFSPDDRYIYYASNQTALDSVYLFDTWSNDLDIYRLESASPGIPEAVTRTEYVNERPVGFASSFEIVYSTDEWGVSNLMKRNAFVNDSTFLTNADMGIAAAAMTDSIVAFTTPAGGRMNVFVGLRDEYFGDHKGRPTQLRRNYNKANEKLPRTKIINLPDLIKDNSTGKIEPDTANKSKLKFYVFDEEESNREEVRKDERRRKGFLNPPKKAKPDFASIEVGKPRRAGTKWRAEEITSLLAFDPAFFGRRYGTKLNVLFEASFADLFRNHQIKAAYRPFLFDFRSGDFSVQYSYLKKRIDYSVGFRRSGRYMNNSDFLLRYHTASFNASATYPFNRFMKLTAFADFAYINRIDLNMNPIGIDGKDYLPGFGLAFDIDKAKTSQGYTTGGHRVNVQSFSTYSTANSELAFTTVKVDVRKYLPVIDKIVLATRLQSGASFGNQEQTFMMGGVENWALSSIQNGQELPLNDPSVSAFHYLQMITPVRGFRYNARNGTKYIAANAELRLPLSRMIVTALNSTPVYNFELIPFFDIGTIWQQGNPLSQRNPINNEPIVSYPLVINVQTLKSPFLLGFGTGARITLFGYSFRGDLAWGMEDYTVQKPRMHLSLAKNF